jgi:hypothetical protein
MRFLQPLIPILAIIVVPTNAELLAQDAPISELKSVQLGDRAGAFNFLCFGGRNVGA